MNREFLGRVMRLCIPMALQNLINTGVMAADVVMIGKVGEKVLSGASLAGQIYFILSLVLFGLCSGASVLIAQYWGKQDTRTIEQVMGIAFRIGMTVSLVFMAVTLAAPGMLMRIFTGDPEVIGYGVQYLRIIAFTYPIEAFVLTYLYVIRSIERVVISTVVYGTSLLINIVGNFFLIYGFAGIPALGVRGAAWATMIARIAELAIVVWYMNVRCREVKVRFRFILRTDRLLNRDFLHYSLPVIINEMMWGLGVSAVAAVIGHLGSAAVSAQAVAQVCRQLAQVMSLGIAMATAIILGKEIGAGRPDVAERYGKNFLLLSLIFGSAGALMILILRPLIVAGMGFGPEAERYLKFFLLVMSGYCVLQAFNTDAIVGIFRAGGDTRYGLFCDVSAMWGFSIPFGAIAAFLLGLPVETVYVILLSDEVLKLFLTIPRYRKKKWLRNVTR